MSDLEPIEYKNSVKKLGDFITLRRGKTYKSSLLGKPGAFLIGLASIEREGGFRDNKLETYGGDCPDSISLKPGDLYVSLKDITHDGHLLGAVSRIPKKIKLGRLTQDTVKLIFDTDDFPKDYIYWLLRTPQYRNYCRSRQTGTTNLGLSREDFLSFPVPPLTEKTDAIIKSLEAIEGKIENLKQQNETLEKIAQTLFKHWFIDFEFPNDDGKPYKSSGGAMVASELGDIPEGWRVGKLGEVADITSSKRIFQSEYQDSGVPFYRSKEIIELSLGQSISTELYISLEKFNEIKEKFSIPQEGDILLTSVGTIGISYIVRKNDYFYFKDGNLTWIKNFRNGFNGILIYFWLKDELTQQQIKVSTIGSTQKALTIQALNNLTLIIYNPLVLSKLIPFFVPIYRKIEQNTNQIQTLTKTRDTLLPKLMSGQIRVKEGESIIEEE